MFAYKLALDLGMTVEDLLNTMSVLEFQGWVRYFEYVAEEQRRASKQAGHKGPRR